MTDTKNIVTLGIGASPGKLLWFITSGLEAAIILDTSVTFEILIPPDDLSLTVPVNESEFIAQTDDYSVIVPEEKTVNTAWYGEAFLVDEVGDFLVDESGNFLVINVITTENVFVVHVPTDDYNVIVPEET